MTQDRDDVARARRELEATLAATWDLDTLAVYADHLQAEGDPRGELIALDLQIRAHGNSPELAKRRTSLLYAWLGGLVPVDNVHRSWVGDSLVFGFVEDLQYEGTDPNAIARLAAVLDSPAGPYVRGVTMSGNAEDLEAALGVLARRTHRWLTRFSIGLWHPLPVIDAEVRAATFAALPNLATLELRPHAAFGAFSHPTLERLQIRGGAVYGALGRGDVFAGVTDLEVDIRTGYADEEEFDVELPEEVARPPSDVEFPALRRLDLSASFPHKNLEVLAFLRELSARVHVTHLVIPQLASAAEHAELVAATRDMRALEIVEIAHGHHYVPPDLPDPKIRLVRAETWPWPSTLAHAGLRVWAPGATYGDDAELAGARALMEDRFEMMAAPLRRAWSELWCAIATLEAEPVAFGAATLADARDGLPELMAGGWREIREELASRRPLAPDAMVRLQRATT